MSLLKNAQPSIEQCEVPELTSYQGEQCCPQTLVFMLYWLL